MTRLLKIAGGVLLALLILVLSVIAPIDRTPMHEQDFYQQMMARLDTLTVPVFKPAATVRVGWSTINITPRSPRPMAGYRPRAAFQSVRDSLFVRIMAVDNGGRLAYLISADLLLFPPALKNRLLERVASEPSPQPFLYFAATHTHNSIGAWHNSILGNFAIGSYDEAWIDSTATQIVSGMNVAYRSALPSSITYFQHDLNEAVENRLAFDQGKIDGWLRGFKVTRADSSDGVFFSFSAHPTSISKSSLALSGDYPAAVSNALAGEFDFGIFMAGMVGSHRFRFLPGSNDDVIKQEAGIVSTALLNAQREGGENKVEIATARVPIVFGPAQVRIAHNWKVRNWLFSWLATPLEGELTLLKIGSIVLVGTPCDFSGELNAVYKLDEQTNDHLIITSFNGDYAGYITLDAHYDKFKREEVRAMNWVGPYYGEYFTDMLRVVLHKLDEHD